MIPAESRVTGTELGRVIRHLRRRSWIFTDWLLRYRSLHEGLKGLPDWDWVGVTESRVLHELTLLPLLTEKHFLEIYGGAVGGRYPAFQALVIGLVETLEAKDPRFSGAAAAVRSNWELTKLMDNPVDPFGRISRLSIPGEAQPAALARAVLLFSVSRNYFAHHYYQHGKAIQTPEGGAIVAGIVTTTLYLSLPSIFGTASFSSGGKLKTED